MHVISSIPERGYRRGMASRPIEKKPAARPDSEIPPPNRIKELTRAAKTTYAKIAEHFGVHEVTIANLARGKARGGTDLTQEWMEKLGAYFGVPSHEIITKPLVAGLRRVKVTGALAAGAWREGFNYDPEDAFDVLIPDEESLRLISLYAGKIEGPSMNKRYADGSVLVFSYVGASPSDIQVGGRYHVRRTQPDGMVEDTVKTLVKDETTGKFWLMPESTDPAHQEWIPLEGAKGTTVELVGRVRYAVQREE